MAKFNNSPKAVKTTKSADGVKAYKKSAHQDLCDRVLTYFYGQDKFYTTGKQADKELHKLITKVGESDPVFLAKLAVLTREKFHLRSVTHVLVAELSRIVSRLNIKKDIDTTLVADVAQRVSIRPDDIIETLAYLIYTYGEKKSSHKGYRYVNKKLSKQLKKGLGNALARFDEYQLDKYKAKTKDIKLKDVFRIVRPKPKDAEQAELWGRLMSDTLKPAETWENKISKTGKVDKKGKSKTEVEAEVAANKKEEWENLILSKKIGYMALLRNIRNIINAGVSEEAHKMALAYLANEKAVINSKLFPFRFYSAYKILSEGKLNATSSMNNDPFSSKYGDAVSSKNIVDRYRAALNKALWHSGKNMPVMKGRTVIATDLSGSMSNRLSTDSDMSYMEVGAVMSALAQQYCEQNILYGFGSMIKLIKLDETDGNPLERARTIMRTSVGHSTDFHKVIKDLINNKTYTDNIFIFTDCQLNGSYGWGSRDLTSDLKQYRRTVNKNVKVYEFNLAASNSSTQLNPNDPNYYHLSGWSDNLLRSVVEMEDMKSGIIDMVNAINI